MLQTPCHNDVVSRKAEQMKTPIYYIEKLKEVAPGLAVITRKTHDQYFRWDGDGEDPEKNGYLPYDVDVEVAAIHKGEFMTGRASLGGSYYKPNEPVGEIHGYLPQMLEEACEDLMKQAEANHNGVWLAANEAHKYMKQVLRDEYSKQMATA